MSAKPEPHVNSFIMRRWPEPDGRLKSPREIELEVLEMALAEERTYQSAANALGIAKSTFQAALKRLRKEVGSEADVAEPTKNGAVLSDDLYPFNPDKPNGSPKTLKESINEVAYEVIRRALVFTNNQKGLAAEELHTTVVTLRAYYGFHNTHDPEQPLLPPGARVLNPKIYVFNPMREDGSRKRLDESIKEIGAFVTMRMLRLTGNHVTNAAAELDISRKWLRSFRSMARSNLHALSKQ